MSSRVALLEVQTVASMEVKPRLPIFKSPNPANTIAQKQHQSSTSNTTTLHRHSDIHLPKHPRPPHHSLKLPSAHSLPHRLSPPSPIRLFNHQPQQLLIDFLPQFPRHALQIGECDDSFTVDTAAAGRGGGVGEEGEGVGDFGADGVVFCVLVVGGVGGRVHCLRQE